MSPKKRSNQLWREPELIPDAILPVQWQQRHQQSNERRLMVAVLEEAINCLALRGAGFTDARRKHLNAHYHRKQQEIAWAWVSSTDNSWLFSFESICAVLGLDADAVRKKLYALYIDPQRPQQQNRKIRHARAYRTVGRSNVTTAIQKGKAHDHNNDCIRGEWEQE